MKRFLPALLSALIILPLQAQETTGQHIPPSPSVIARISLISPKILVEFAPSESFTLTTGFWLRTSFWTTNAYGDYVYHPQVTPSFTLEPRFYFNLDQRKAKGKRTDYYSGWYLGVPFNIEFPELRYSIGGTVGFQSTLGKRWYWTISFGPGITYEDARFHASGAGDLGLGIILNKM